MSAAPTTPVRPADWHPEIPDAEECRARVGRLGPRQRQVVSMVARGWSPKQTARELGITEKTVHNTLCDARRVLGVSSSSQAVAVVHRANEAREPATLPAVWVAVAEPEAAEPAWHWRPVSDLRKLTVPADRRAS